ncbi:uncharacterized protein LOC131163755 isoform X2 [Malania oleifera]|uniref:uncharacterized protein LOC131163755 isoform X2 n=1 Tax=Malania oleifera TaxID=397392 RepID=UPI0025ADF10F|nr:uncharacterized protein LOC131163755 isoform X2 [Malania oleifera]XP_057976453.1 uncharacterized protein LOC131163755 isoform X2 [Malania oleifera]XP_057976454.1 uncharacterized protein LOC131163755 isoform X2 [Malania oleifera]XP_057976455.1 uncharacterized protein LOC131163755 isoform X2 [Malania oleifera]XP_057976456.1 uncharacterized protein LOC131163755 isoform X2 [Malania oleifera]XP_057976457.1 uncharacterized protein LOC131163755 isoform X2 [Malania oleifera]
MHYALVNKFFLLYILVISGISFNNGNIIDNKVLNVGEELQKETLPLQMGSRLYQLQGLKSNTWYEVKISYPASIPSSFSVQLRKGVVDFGLNQNRRLLNTEKLIFKTDSLNLLGDQDGMYVLVTVEPEGIVAIPRAQERQFVIFNIVCDELLLGIPHKAWWVVILVLLCLGLALFIPCFLPSNLLRRDHNMGHAAQRLISKNS